MIDYIHKDLFLKSDTKKELMITFDGGTITNHEMHQGSFTLEESICSESSLVFGTCESSVLKFKVHNIFTDLKNKWLDVAIILNKDTSNPFKIGRFKVESYVPTADGRKRDVTAYDALHDIINADVAKWYNELLPNKESTVTMKQFRSSFFTHFGVEEEAIELANDSMTVAKTIETEELSGKTVINAICEINGCFGHIGRNNKFKYIYLEEMTDALYPSHDLYPKNDLYPVQPRGASLVTGVYIPPATYEAYVTKNITGIVIRKEENDIGGQVGTLDNPYMIQDNFLAYGKSAEDLQEIGNNILEKIKHISYRPFSTKAKGNPCIEVGDFVRLSTRSQRVQSYVLQRTLTGIQSMRDDYSSMGEENQPQNVNSSARQIQQLKGKTNTLTRTVDETRSELKNFENETETMFQQTAEQILAEAKRAQEAEASLSIRADEIALSVTNLEENTQSSINILAEAISLKVEAEDVQSMIDVSLSEIHLSSDQISLEGYTTINGGFSIDNDGNATLENDYARITLGGYDLDVIRKDMGEGGSFGASAISHYGMQWMTVVNAGTEGVNRYIMLGNPSEKINDIYVRYINNGTPVTGSNISNYLSDLEERVLALEEIINGN